MPRRPAFVLALTALFALTSACRSIVWLGEDRDGALRPDAFLASDAGSPDAAVTPDATPGLDDTSADVGSDAFIAPTCATHDLEITNARTTSALDAASLAASGAGATLRFGVLVPPAVRPTGDETLLVLLDRDGASIGERLLDLRDGLEAPSSASTLHALSPTATEEGFLLLSERAIVLLDRDGADLGPAVPLAGSPNRARQRDAAWLDDDRFAFVDATDHVSVFDRATGAVTATPIDVAGRASVLVDPGGVTVTSAGLPNEVVVYDPDLTGTELLRTTWSDEAAAIGTRLSGTHFSGTQRTWLVRASGEFRAGFKSYAVPDTGDPVLGPSAVIVGPFGAIALEDDIVAIVDSSARLTLFSFRSGSFGDTSLTLALPAAFTSERDGAHAAVLSMGTGPAGTTLVLRCGLVP